MTKRTSSVHLTRRERQMMDILYQLQRASAEEIRERLPDPPSNSSVRTMLRILEDKGHIRHEHLGGRFLFIPVVKADTAKRSALRHLVDTFFGGSGEDAIGALFDISARDLGDEELADLRSLIAKAAKERSTRS